MTQTHDDFEQLVRETGQSYRHPPQRTSDCLPNEAIVDHVFDGRPQDSVAEHIAHCERCWALATRIELAQQARKRRIYADKQVVFSPLRLVHETETPQYPRQEPGTTLADDVNASSLTRYEMCAATDTCSDTRRCPTAFGEVTIEYHWGERGDKQIPYISFEWQQELPRGAVFGIRVFDPLTNTPLLEVSPDIIAEEDSITFEGDELPFNPLKDSWDFRIAPQQSDS